MHVLKPILVLVLGCVPLAVLTVNSLAGLGTVAEQFPMVAADSAASISVALPSPEALDDDVALRAAVADRELLAGEPLPPHTADADPAYCQTLSVDWAHWTDACRLVEDVLRFEQGLRDPDSAQLEAAVSRIGEIQEQCRREKPVGGDRLAAVLERQSRQFQAEIRRLDRKKIALRLIGDANKAYNDSRLDECIELYDQALNAYADVLDAGTVAHAESSRRRARFRIDVDRLTADLPRATLPTQRRRLLETFLDTYPDHDSYSVIERTKLDDFALQLAEVRRQIADVQMNEAAKAPLAGLGRLGTRPLAERLAAAARIARTYPTDWVRGQLQTRVTQWLTESLAEKQLDEPPDLEEVETASGTILRGFFEPVTDAGGTVIGYKRYDSAHERRNPTKTVGRYPVDQFRFAPAASVPRRCEQAYAAARRRALADPADQAGWTGLATVCDQAELLLIDYRRKPGSSRESLAFDSESRFARIVLTPELWTHIELIWSP